MRKFALLALLAACNQRAAGPRLEWAPDETTAFQRAKVEHRGVIVEVYASWAMSSVEVDRMLHDGALAAQLGGWIAFRRDVSAGTDDDAAWQARHAAEVLPWIGFFDDGGLELAHVDHAVGPDELVARAASARTGTPSSR